MNTSINVLTVKMFAVALFGLGMTCLVPVCECAGMCCVEMKVGGVGWGDLSWLLATHPVALSFPLSPQDRGRKDKKLVGVSLRVTVLGIM